MMEIRGIHPIPGTAEPVHLIDIVTVGRFDEVPWGEITQSDPNQPRENWQAVYDERELPPLPDGRVRAAFFFYYLDLSRPLETPDGPCVLPSPTPVPEDLAHIEYEEP